MNVTRKDGHGESASGTTDEAENGSRESEFMAGQKGPQEAPTNSSGWLYYDFGIMIVVDIGVICGDNGIGSWAGYVSGTWWSWGGLWDSRNSLGQPTKRLFLGRGNREGERV